MKLIRSIDRRGRAMVTARAEQRAEGEDDGLRITGHAAVFDEPTVLWPGYREVIRHGAFDEALAAGPDVRGLFNHDDNYVLGRTTSGTLRVTADETGLRYEIDAPRSQTIRDLVIEPMRRGDIDGASFAFVALEDEEMRMDDGTVLREIRKADLFDVSPVTYPAYQAATAQLEQERCLANMIEVRGLDLTPAELRSRLAAMDPDADPQGGEAERIRDRRRRDRLRLIGGTTAA